MWFPILAVTNLICCGGKYAINAFASGADGTLFLNKTGDLADVYKVAITPAGWTFSIWGFIYTFEMLWVVYSLTLLCRGPEINTNPVFFPCTIPFLNIVGCCLNVAWLLTFDRQEIIAAFVTLVLYSLLYYSMLAVTYITLDRASPKLVEKGDTKDIWLTRALLHNGLAMQGTWVTIATLLNLAMVMQYEAHPGVGLTDASTIILSVLAVLILVFAITDLGFLDRFSRYTFTPYIVLVVALIGSISKNYEEGARNSIFTVVLLSLAGALLIIKLVVSTVRHVKGHSFSTSYDTTIGGSNKGNLA